MNLEEIRERAKNEKDKIIQHRKGPAIIIAGPGSGKTRTLAERLINLCYEDSCDPTRIIAVTFSNHAADEMKEKVKEICEKSLHEPPDLRISTMHFLAKGLLHRYSKKLNLPASFRVVGKLQERILLDDVSLELKRQKVKLGRYQNKYLNRFKAYRAFIPNSFLNKIVEIPSKNGLATQEQFDESYRSLLDYYYAVDWYDVVALAVKLLDENRDILDEVTGKIDHLLVDEYQDLNCADHKLIHLLSTKAKSLMVFGDDDQSIYQTGRFANPGGVKRFNETYPDAIIYPLSICWRCGTSILDMAWKLVDVDENRLPERMPKEKPISSHERGTGEFEIKSFKSEKAEIQGLCSDVKKELERASDIKNILILFHSKEIGLKYADALKTNGFQIENLLGKSQTVSKAALLLYEILRLINNEADNLAARFLLQEFFTMSPQDIIKVRDTSRGQNKSLWQTMTDDIDVPEKIKLWSKNFIRWRQIDNVIEMLKEIISSIEIHNEPEIQKFIEWCSKESNLTLDKILGCLEKGFDFDEPAPSETNDGAIKIVTMTMHGAKGLDADIVFVPALEDELIPNQWFEPEQRRLLYVSMTRAKKRLFLSWSWSRTGRTTYRSSNRAETHRKRSKFLDEIER